MNTEKIFDLSDHEKIDRQWSNEAQDLRVKFMNELKGKDIDLVGDVNGLLNTLLRMTSEQAKDQLQLSIKERSLDLDLATRVANAINPKELSQAAEAVMRSIIDKYKEGTTKKDEPQGEDIRLAA